jgi:hypothetical protein
MANLPTRQTTREGEVMKMLCLICGKETSNMPMTICDKCFDALMESQRPTLRDQFAMAALTGYLTRGVIYGGSVKELVKHCYEIADAMMAERTQNENGGE